MAVAGIAKCRIRGLRAIAASAVGLCLAGLSCSCENPVYEGALLQDHFLDTGAEDTSAPTLPEDADDANSGSDEAGPEDGVLREDATLPEDASLPDVLEPLDAEAILDSRPPPLDADASP